MLNWHQKFSKQIFLVFVFLIFSDYSFHSKSYLSYHINSNLIFLLRIELYEIFLFDSLNLYFLHFSNCHLPEIYAISSLVLKMFRIKEFFEKFIILLTQSQKFFYRTLSCLAFCSIFIYQNSLNLRFYYFMYLIHFPFQKIEFK